MAKTKRQRQLFHLSKQKNQIKKPEVVKTAAKKKKSNAIKHGPKKVPTAQLDAVENIFAGINIQLDALNKFDDGPDPVQLEPIKKSVPEEPEVPEEREIDEKLTEIQWNFKMTATKKEKLKLKRSKLMEKMDVTQQAREKSQKKRQQTKLNTADTQSLLPSRAEIKSILTPAAVKPAAILIPTAVKPTTKTIEGNLNAFGGALNTIGGDGKPEAKNVFAVPTFNDDLPALSNIFKITPVKVAETSKAISKGKNKQKSKQKQHFVKICNLMKKLMAKKAKK